MFKIAIIGRTNVGKSTLFNKLVGRKFAITDDAPGVTRDRKEARGHLAGLDFMVIDTAGLENEIDANSLQQRMFEQSQMAVMDADLCLFVVDGREGVTPKDFYFAQWLRKLDKKTILLANKCENFSEEVFDKDYYKLGFGKPIAVSAEHKLGFGDLYEEIAPEIEKYEENFAEVEDEEKPDLQIAIIGKPNAGKSTLLNKILGQERVITGAEAGITRDTIAVNHEFNGKKMRFVDTAGIRRKATIKAEMEKASVFDSFRAVRFAQIVILLVDANSVLDHQDMALAGEVLKEGRGLIFAINKIDEVKRDKEEFMREVRTQIQELFPEINGAAIVGISAKNGYNVEKLLNFAIKTHEQWQIRIPTSRLNEWLKMAETNHAPKLYKGKAVKLKFASQIKRNPPTFAVFVNHIKPLEGSYQRYLLNFLRESFDLNLTPIRLYLRKSDNPFEGRKEKKFSKKVFQNNKKAK